MLETGIINYTPFWAVESSPFPGSFLVVQWLRLSTPNAGGPGSIPGQRTRSHVPQLKVPNATPKKKKTLHDATKIEDPQVPQLRPGTAKETILLLVHQPFPQIFAEVALILFHPLLFHQH